MKKTILTSLLTLSLLILSVPMAQAALLKTYVHNYGNGTNQVDPGGDDSLFDGYVLVKDGDHDRFSDTFDLSGLNYASIDRFELTLNYSDAFCLISEWWRVRPGGADDKLDLSLYLANSGPTTFVIDSSIATFASMVNSGSFFYWLAEETSEILGSDKFKLCSATLKVYGTAATPIPGAVWLLGSGLVGLVGLRRRMRG